MGAVAGIAAGVIGGGQKDRVDNISTVAAGQESEQEEQARLLTESSMSQLENLVNLGPGGTQVQQAQGAANNLTARLSQIADSDFMPSREQQEFAQTFARQQFAPRQEMLRQSFEEQNQRTAQLAAQLGRPVNDPILQARLAQEQIRQQAALGAEQQAFASRQALGLEERQRSGQVSALSDILNVRQGLASQAFQNRQALLTLGSQIQAQGQNFRIQTATRRADQHSGGGTKGAIAGGFGAASAMANMASGFMGGGGGGGGGSIFG